MIKCECCMYCYNIDNCDYRCSFKCEVCKYSDSEARELNIGGLYKHFKNNYYMVRGEAISTEDNIRLVLYSKVIDGILDDTVYARPYDVFMSKVDRNKYPNANQKYRFELVLKK